MSQLKFFQFKKESFTLFMHFFSEDFEIEKRGCVTEIPEKFNNTDTIKKKDCEKIHCKFISSHKKIQKLFQKM